MTKHILIFKQSGFSLMEGLVAMGLMGAAALGFMTYSKNVSKQEAMTNLRRSISQIRQEGNDYINDSRTCGESLKTAFSDLQASTVIDSLGNTIVSSPSSMVFRKAFSGTPKILFESGKYIDSSGRIMVSSVTYKLTCDEADSTRASCELSLDIGLESCIDGGRHKICSSPDEVAKIRTTYLKYNRLVGLNFDASGALAEVNCSGAGGPLGGGGELSAQDICDQMGANFEMRDGQCTLNPSSLTCASPAVLTGINPDGSPICRSVRINDILEFRALGNCANIVLTSSSGSTSVSCAPPPPATPPPEETCLQALAARQSTTCSGQPVTRADGAVCGNGTKPLLADCPAASNLCQNQNTVTSCGTACPGTKISRQYAVERELSFNEGKEFKMSNDYRNFCFEGPSPGTPWSRYVRECRESLPSSSSECDAYATGTKPCTQNSYDIRPRGATPSGAGSFKKINECFIAVY